MNAERLLAHYEKLVDAPDAVDQLRHYILESAIRGDLVSQDPRDARVPELDDDLLRSFKEPFPIPKTWRWVRLQKLGKLKGGGTPSKARDDFWMGIIPWVSPKDMKRDYIADAQMKISDEAMANSAVSLIETGSILFVVRGMILAHSFPVALTLKPITINQDMKAISLKNPEMGEYILRALRGLKTEMLKRVQRSSHGTCRLEGSDYSEFPVPLPPLAEQQRIVAKVDELMALCDQLETARADREAARDCLAGASLARLAAPTSETFQADIRFTLDALPELTTRPDQIKALRQTIISLAVRGRLAPQDTSDEPASKLLTRVAEELTAYTKANRIGQAQADPISDHDLPFTVPDSWRWTRLSSLFKVITDGDHQPPPKADKGVAFLTISNVTTGRLDFAGCRLVPETYFRSLAAYRTPAKGDILYTVVGATYGRPALVETDRAFCVQRHIAILKPAAAMSLRYLLALLTSPMIYDQATRSTTGTAQPTIALRPLRNFLVPLPPLAEQHRIVAKVDVLMALCDRLEAALVAANSARARLLGILLAEALAPENDSSEATTVEPTAAAASLGATVTTERSAFVLSLAYERHRAARRERTFGHVKAEKILHLVEAEAGLDLGRVPIRIAAGPADFPRLLSVDEWARQHRRFDFGQKGKGYTFQPLAEFQLSLQMAETIDAPMRARIEAIIDTFVPLDTEAAELFATVYAAWNNLLIDGKPPKDDDILRAAREDWHPKKLQIPREKFVVALQHVKASALVPSGRGKFVPPAPQRDLFLKQ